MDDLSDNERLVLPLFADGKKPSNREIADRFGWSMGKVAGLCHRLQLKNMIPARRDIQFIRERSVVKGPTCQYIKVMLVNGKIVGEDPNRSEFMCGKPITNGSYCFEHYSRCYDRKRTAQWS